MVEKSERIAWLSRLALIDPARAQRRLSKLQRAGLIDRAPNLWQVTLGILRMWHRVLFRSDSIGTCRHHPVRDTWRARLLENRALRFPFLVVERAITPWDFSGLISSEERIRKHLLGAHHDGAQFIYDFELLMGDRPVLERIRDEAQAVVEGTHPRAAWLRDLVVYDGYHENLLAALDCFLAGDTDPKDLDDPDLTLTGYLRWCARQPATPRATFDALRDGTLSLSSDPEGWQREVERLSSPATEEAACA